MINRRLKYSVAFNPGDFFGMPRIVCSAGYITVQRAREIGIRKVLGAGVMEIVILISKDFIKLIVIASVFAFPIAWLSMNSWLQGFAYRININVMVFLLAEIATTIIAFLTISFQAVRAAHLNPIKSLKAE